MANENNNNTAMRPKMGRGVVARGRTVVAPSGEKKIIGYTTEGKTMWAPDLKHFRPGQEVELPESEIAWLRGTGHLIDPNAPADLPADGAHVTEKAPAGVVGFVGQEARA
jgi:hypothetical protein